MVWLSWWSGMPLLSKARGPLKPRVSASSTSKRPLPVLSTHLPME
jgi:hypothetical protein